MKCGLYLECWNGGTGVVWQRCLRLLSGANPAWRLSCVGYRDDAYCPQEGMYPDVESLLAAIRGGDLMEFGVAASCPTGETLDRPIEVWEDFVASNCRSILVCVDGGYFEVYTRDAETLNQLMAFAQEIGAQGIKWIDDQQIDRTSFNVW